MVVQDKINRKEVAYKKKKKSRKICEKEILSLVTSYLYIGRKGVYVVRSIYGRDGKIGKKSQECVR